VSSRRRRVEYQWCLREVMATNGLWKTTQLSPLLAQRGVPLSAAQTYRLVTGKPERLSLQVLAALCDIFNCTPADLITIGAVTARSEEKTKPERPAARRPRRARIVEDS
jgi:DNA-binding Xre family transcriptional regulator